MVRKLSARKARAAPHLIWNAFVDLIATEEYSALTSKQRLAHLAFQYESEVQNGGHYQYFVNQSGTRAPETVDALTSLELDAQADVLGKAISRWHSQVRTPPVTADHFVQDAELDEFGDLDQAFHACPRSILDALSAYLSANQTDFVLLENDDN